MNLIEHLNVTRKALELAIIRDATQANPDMDESFIVLDDITPCYLSARAALSVCDATLAGTLHALLGAYPTKVEACVSKLDRFRLNQSRTLDSCLTRFLDVNRSTSLESAAKEPIAAQQA